MDAYSSKMIVKEKVTYTFDGREYSTIDEARAHAENKIGAILDKMNPRLPPKEALQLLNILVEHKTELCGYLLAESDCEYLVDC